MAGDSSWNITENDIMRPRDPDRDYEATVAQHKVIYATLNRFDRSIFGKTTTWNNSLGKPNDRIGGLEDTISYTLGIDIDTEEGPNHKTILDSEFMREGVEAVGRFFIDKLYAAGIKKSIHCLYSGGGAYIFIHHELTKASDDWDPKEREDRFVTLTLSYNAFINETRDEFFREYPKFRGIIAVDALNNRKRIFKSIFSMHKDKKVAVIPLDKNNFKINTQAARLPLSDAVIESGKSWYDEFDINEKDALMELLGKYADREEVIQKIANASPYRTPDEPVAYISKRVIPIEEFPSCMYNIIMNIGPGTGKTRAIAVLAPFLKQSGWTDYDADILGMHLCARAGLDPRYFWDNWKLKTTNCSKLMMVGNGYPDHGIGELGFCKRCDKCNTNPINYGWPKEWYSDTADTVLENETVKEEVKSTTTTKPEVKGVALKVQKDKELQSDKLMRLAREDGLKLWHNTDHEAYATIDVDGHGENLAVKSSSFRNWLSRLLYAKESRVPGGQVLSDVISTMSGNAEFDGEEFETHNRVAEHDGKIYVDMGDPSWRAIEIYEGSWKIINNPPIKFVRPRGMLALPEPVRGGKLADIKEIINTSNDNNWILIAAWMTQAFWPRGPYAHLSIGGEQGSLKTSMTRMLKMIMDPSKTALRRMPRTEEEMMIAAKRERVLSFDNLSGIAKNMSDALCSLATGGSFGKRALYENDEEHSITAMRPAILNGLDAIGSRNDLLDRTIVIELTEAEKRSSQAKIDKQFEELRPKMIGALLDITAYGWSHPIQDEPEDLPRMADFALWVIACEKALEWDTGTFLAVYNESRDTTLEDAINDDRLANAIKAHTALYANEENKYEYSVKSTDLFKELCDAAGVDRNHPPRGWPSTVQSMGRAISRISLGMRKQGYHIISKRDDSKRRLKIITLDKKAIEEISNMPKPQEPKPKTNSK